MNRPVNYERALWDDNTDMYVPQYPSAAWLEEIGKMGSDRPVILSEYSHAMVIPMVTSISSGKPFTNTPIFKGAYIWDWVDQGMEAIDENGRLYYNMGVTMAPICPVTVTSY